MPPVSRPELRRALVINAATKPANVLVPAGVAMAGLLLAVVWLVPVALACWLAMSVQTFLDEGEAERVGARLRAVRPAPVARELAPAPRFAPEIAARVRAARFARASIRHAIETSDSPLEEVTREIDVLVLALEGHAARAQRIHEFLAGDVAAEPRERVQRRLTQLFEEMDRVVVALQTVHAEILVTDGLEQSALAQQISDLRADVQAVSAGLEAAFADSR
jgi:hypothetical protein